MPCVCIALAVALAQAPRPIAPEALAAHLAGWEKVMQGAGNFYCKDVTKVHENRITKKTTTSTGEIMCRRQGQVRLRLKVKPAPGQKADPNDYIAYICTGREVYEYDGAAKVVTEYKLADGDANDSPVFSFLARAFAVEKRVFDPLSGVLKADGAAGRFIIQLARQDRNYIYLDLTPRLPRDKAEFQSITLVLYQPVHRKQAYLPAHIRIVAANGDRLDDWSFAEPAVNVEIRADDFKYVEPPEGWKVLRPQSVGR